MRRWVETCAAALCAAAIAAGAVYAAGGKDRDVKAHLTTSGIHMTADTHRELGEIHAKVNEILRRLP